MTTDQELLEAAAKAFWGEEIDDVCSVRWLEADQAIGYTHGDNQDHNGVDREFVWNPLTDDGDALRLAVKLDLSSMMIFQSDGSKRREFWTPNSGYDGGKAACTEKEYAADPYAATRRAIVRAAAAIGANLECIK